jgi:hypothetical protein
VDDCQPVFSKPQVRLLLSFLRVENLDGIFDGTGHMEGVMRTERNQPASVGRLRIGSLSDALPEKEVFQSARIHREGIATPILAEETPSFHSTTVRVCNTFLYVSQKPSSTSANHCTW